MIWLSAFLYLVGCFGAFAYVDVLKHKPGLTIGALAYIFCWPVSIPCIWLYAVFMAVIE